VCLKIAAGTLMSPQPLATAQHASSLCCNYWHDAVQSSCCADGAANAAGVDKACRCCGAASTAVAAASVHCGCASCRYTCECKRWQRPQHQHKQKGVEHVARKDCFACKLSGAREHKIHTSTQKGYATLRGACACATASAAPAKSSYRLQL
jgi:hypothetical protein